LQCPFRRRLKLALRCSKFPSPNLHLKAGEASSNFNKIGSEPTAFNRSFEGLDPFAHSVGLSSDLCPAKRLAIFQNLERFLQIRSDLFKL
jgi:hypothetical protein